MHKHFVRLSYRQLKYIYKYRTCLRTDDGVIELLEQLSVRQDGDSGGRAPSGSFSYPNGAQGNWVQAANVANHPSIALTNPNSTWQTAQSSPAGGAQHTASSQFGRVSLSVSGPPPATPLTRSMANFESPHMPPPVVCSTSVGGPSPSRPLVEGAIDENSAGSDENSAGEPRWKCPQCTFDNYPLLNTCEMCGTARPPSTPRMRSGLGSQSTFGSRPSSGSSHSSTQNVQHLMDQMQQLSSARN